MGATRLVIAPPKAKEPVAEFSAVRAVAFNVTTITLLLSDTETARVPKSVPEP